MSISSKVRLFLFLLVAASASAALVLADVVALSQNTNSSTTMPQETGMAAAQENTGGGVNEDLSGTYTGTVRMTGGHEMSGEGTLTITGNTFTLTVDTMNHSGRVYAINTRKYVGAAFYFTDVTDPISNTPLAASVRVRRRGNTFTLEPVPGARNRLSFRGRSS
jgi:hypothetical protein